MRCSLLVAQCYAAVCLVSGQVTAGIISSGNVLPPFVLTGPAGTFTVPTGGSTGGGVIVGDTSPGTLTIADDWTLNSTTGIIANGIGSSTPSPSQLTITNGGTWNLEFDLDIGNSASGIAQLTFRGEINARSIRVGSSASGFGQLQMDSSSVATQGPTVVGFESTADLIAANNSELTAGWFVLGERPGSAGNAQFLSGSILSAPTGGVYVGGRGQGALHLASGASANVLFTLIGYDADFTGLSDASGFGDITVTGTGTLFNNAEAFAVAFNTRGSATISDGARLDATSLEISRYSDDGSLTVHSGAQINLRPGGSFTTVSMVFATEADSIAVGDISDPGTVINATGTGAFAEVARGGSANVTVSGGAVVNAGATIIATNAGSFGMLDVTGSGSQWNAAGSFEVARGGTGALTVGGGASVSTPMLLFVGGDSGSSGELVITGTGLLPSKVSSQQQALFGLHGTANVSVRNGARLESNKATSATSTSGLLAQFNDSIATVLVSDANSVWTGDGGVNVGFRGAATLTVQSGGRVESADGILARLPGSSGTVNLANANSRWVIGNALYVGGRPASGVAGSDGQAGPGGIANLNVASGAVVSVGSTMRIFSGGTVDLSGGGSLNVQGVTAVPGRLRVFDDGSLYASGTIKGTLVNSGHLYAGESIGTLNVQGTLQSTGTTHFDVASATSYDKIVVSGAATLSGALSLNAIGTPTFLSTDRMDLLTAGSITGSFFPVSGNRLDATHWLAVIYRNNKVTLALGQPGDATLDGAINFDDLLTVAMNYGGSFSNVDWRSGDFDANGVVDFTDLLKVAQRYGTTYIAGSSPTGEFLSDWALAQSLVPEPAAATSMVLLLSPRRRFR